MLFKCLRLTAYLLLIAVLAGLLFGCEQKDDNEFGTPIKHVETKNKMIAVCVLLRHGQTAEQLLNVLERQNCEATFFITGNWIYENKHELKRIVQNGHEVGNGSANYAAMTKLTAQQQLLEIKEVNRLISQCVDVSPALFTPPYGQYDSATSQACAQEHLVPVVWDIEFCLEQGQNAEKLVKSALKKAVSGTIINIAPDMYTSAAAENLFQELKDKGYRIVSISQMLYKENFYVDSDGVQRQLVITTE